MKTAVINTSGKRSKQSISNDVVQRKEKYNGLSANILNEKDVTESRGLDKAIECFLKRDGECFWDNFWFVVASMTYHTCSLISPFTPAADCNTYPPGEERIKCESRMVASGRCIVADHWWYKIPGLGTPSDIGEIDYCLNIQIPELEKFCRDQCKNVYVGEQYFYEAGGCDTYTPWCWCNKEEYT